MGDQVNISVTDLIPPSNIATIDKDGLVGNAVSKDKFQTDLSDFKTEIQGMIESDFKGPISPTDPTPTEDGSYKPSISSADPGTNYPNAGNLKAIKGFSTMFYKKGSVWTKSEEEMAKASQNIAAFEALQFPAASGTQAMYDGAMWQVKTGKTAISSDIPTYNSDVWNKVIKSDDLISTLSDNSISNKTVSSTIDKILRNEPFQQTIETLYRVDGIVKSGQYIKSDGTITTTTGSRQTIEIQVVAGITVKFKGYNVGVSGTVPNVVFINSSLVATVVSPGGSSGTIAAMYEGAYTPTESGTIYINTDSRAEYADRYLYYNSTVRVDGILKSSQYIKPDGTISTSTGTRQTIEIKLTAGVKAFFKGYNAGSGGTIPNVVFVNSNSIATVVLPGGSSSTVPVLYEGTYTPTANGTLYINVDSRAEYADRYLYYNSGVINSTLDFRKKMLSANSLDLKTTSIAWCGDSITRYGLDQSYGKGFQLIIQESVKFNTSTTYATGGYTLANLNASSTNWVSHTIFSLLIGINDHRTAVPLGVLTDFDNNTNNGTFYAELRKYVDKVYSLNTKAMIILCTPPQVNTFPFTSTNPRNSFTKNSLNFDLNDYADAIRTVAKKYSFPFADLFNDANQNILNIQQLTVDGVHQNSEGYRKLANIIMNAVNKVI